MVITVTNYTTRNRPFSIICTILSIESNARNTSQGVIMNTLFKSLCMVLAVAAGSLGQGLLVEPDSLLGGASWHYPIPGSEGKIINTTGSDIMIDSILVISISNPVDSIDAGIYINGQEYYWPINSNKYNLTTGVIIPANDTIKIENTWCNTGDNLDYQNTSGPDDPLIHSFWLETHVHYQDTFLTLYLRGADLDPSAPIQANILRASIQNTLGTSKIYNLRGQVISNKQNISNLPNQATGIVIQHNGNHSNKSYYKK